MKTFDPTKPVQTRDGRKARIICTDAKFLNTNKGIIALIPEDETGRDLVYDYFESGKRSIGTECNMDLINIPEKKVVKGYIIIWKSGLTGFTSHIPAVKEGECEAIIPIEKEYTVGEGLEKVEEED